MYDGAVVHLQYDPSVLGLIPLDTICWCLLCVSFTRPHCVVTQVVMKSHLFGERTAMKIHLNMPTEIQPFLHPGWAHNTWPGSNASASRIEKLSG